MDFDIANHIYKKLGKELDEVFKEIEALSKASGFDTEHIVLYLHYKNFNLK